MGTSSSDIIGDKINEILSGIGTSSSSSDIIRNLFCCISISWWFKYWYAVTCDRWSLVNINAEFWLVDYFRHWSWLVDYLRHSLVLDTAWLVITLNPDWLLVLIVDWLIFHHPSKSWNNFFLSWFRDLFTTYTLGLMKFKYVGIFAISLLVTEIKLFLDFSFLTVYRKFIWRIFVANFYRKQLRSP